MPPSAAAIATVDVEVGPLPPLALPGEPAPNVYTRLGVQPFVNCCATTTINGGSRTLPAVIAAMHEAMHYHVDMDELITAAGKRVADLLVVDAAMVTSGAASALALAAMACVAGTDPEKMQRLPDTAGFERRECIIPTTSRTHYDHAVRMAGLVMVEVTTAAELHAAIGPRTAMALVTADRFGVTTSRADRKDGSQGQKQQQRAGDGESADPLSLQQLAPLMSACGIPVVVDAAADYPLVPNPYLAQGATLVAYSAGKILRGPQGGGILLGSRALVRAAVAHGSPHHALGRPLKVPKEVIVGVVTAVEHFLRDRDLQAEYAEWRQWYAHISSEISQVNGVTTAIGEPSAGGPFPILEVSWDRRRVPITAQALHDQLLLHPPTGWPPIQTHAAGPGHSFPIRPAALKPGQYKLVASRLRQVFHAAATSSPAAVRGTTGASDSSEAAVDGEQQQQVPHHDVSGVWDVYIRFGVGEAQHQFILAQTAAGGGESVQASPISGTHTSRFSRHARPLPGIHGQLHGESIQLQSSLTVPATSIALEYTFNGRIVQTGDAGMGGSGMRMVMDGTLDLSQDDCGGATFRATRRGEEHRGLDLAKTSRAGSSKL